MYLGLNVADLKSSSHKNDNYLYRSQYIFSCLRAKQELNNVPGCSQHRRQHY